MVAKGSNFIGSMAVNLIHPIASTIIVMILGRHSHSDLACFGIVHSVMSFTVGIFSFLPNFVTSKVGKSVGSERWHRVSKHVRAALMSALLVACMASGLLLVAKPWLFDILHVRRSQSVSVDGYYGIRLLALPTMVMCQTVGGVLAGYQRLYAAVIVVTVQSVLEVAAMYLIFEVWNMGLAQSGYAYLFGSSIGMIVGLFLIVLLPPKAAIEAGAKIEVFSFPSISLSSLLPWLTTTPEQAAAEEEVGNAGAPQTTEEVFKTMETAPISPKLPSLESGENLLSFPPLGPSALSAEQQPLIPPVPAQFRDLRITLDDGNHAAADKKGQQQQQQQAQSHLPPETPVRQFRYIKSNSLMHTFATFIAETGDMALRQLVMQTHIFLASICCNRISPQYQAAFQIIERIWMLCTHVFHAFQTLNAMEGSKAIGAGVKAGRDLILLLWKTLVGSAVIGVAFGLLLWLLAPEVCSVFGGAKDPKMLEILLTVFPIILWAKPLDSISSAYDGLLFAAQSFSFMRNREVLGFVFIYLPSLALAYFYYGTFAALWVPRALFVAWRTVAGGYHIHRHLVPQWKSMLASAPLFACPPSDAESLALTVHPPHSHHSSSSGSPNADGLGLPGPRKQLSPIAEQSVPLLQGHDGQRYGATEEGKSPVAAQAGS